MVREIVLAVSNLVHSMSEMAAERGSYVRTLFLNFDDPYLALISRDPGVFCD